MNKQEFISKLEDIGFIKTIGYKYYTNGNPAPCHYYVLLNYEVHFYKNNKNAYISIISNYAITILNSNDTFEEILISITKLPEIQYMLRTKKLNKLLNR